MMSESNLDIARQRLLAPAGIDENDLNRVFGKLLGHAVDSGDLYFQSTRFESWVLEDGIVKEGTHSIEQGAGVRAARCNPGMPAAQIVCTRQWIRLTGCRRTTRWPC